MGSWYGTCLISNLPIYMGDEVVFFTLKRKFDVNVRHCNADDLYEPLLYPVVGEYDDYGSIENVKENFSMLEEYFKDVELTQNHWDKDNDVFQNIERGNYNRHSFALIHKDIYDALLEKTKDRGEWWTKGKSLRDHVVENLDKKIEMYSKEKQIWGDDAAFISPTLGVGVEDIICGRNGRDFFIGRYLETKDDVLRNKLIDTHLIHVVMSECRKFWFPQSGAGSQSSEIELYEILANKMIEKCKQQKQKWED
jgi:hypothetical protein